MKFGCKTQRLKAGRSVRGLIIIVWMSDTENLEKVQRKKDGEEERDLRFRRPVEYVMLDVLPNDTRSNLNTRCN